MTITDYVSEQKAVTPNADILQRWASRVVAGSLHTRGADGADAYMGQYGKGMKAPKAAAFARCAEINGYPAFACRMWEHAFFLAHGRREVLAPGAAPAIAPTPASGPAPAIAGTAAVEFEVKPQLLVAVDRATALTMAANSRYAVQEKVDGVRFMVAARGSGICAGNKRGLSRPLPLNVTDTLTKLRDQVGVDLVLDGELVGSTYHVFDVLEFGRSLQAAPLQERLYELSIIEQALPRLHVPESTLRVVPTALQAAEKLDLIAKLEAGNKEGFVMKRLDASYSPGDKHRTQWKYQFRGLAAVICGEQKPGKNSVEMLVNQAGSAEQRSLGFVTIPPSSPIPKKGEIIEVEYLYCHPGAGGKLAQPVFKGVRDDVLACDCIASKLRVKEDPEADDGPAEVAAVEIPVAQPAMAAGASIWI